MTIEEKEMQDRALNSRIAEMEHDLFEHRQKLA
jgi:hypothetical protein